MKIVRRTTAAIVVAVAVAAATTGVAHAAHFLGYDSVDGRTIAYEDYTRYDTALGQAVSAWNNYGSVSIIKDTASTVTDLQVGDYSDTQPGAAWGYYQTLTPGADTIKLNTSGSRMGTTASDGDTKRRRTVTHELGHGLGIGDHPESTYSGTLMYGYMNSTGVPSSPAAHDVSDYRSLWG